MGGGPIFPHSVTFPSNAKAFPNTHVGGVNSRQDEGVGVMASLNADVIVGLRFQLPKSFPSGTAK